MWGFPFYLCIRNLICNPHETQTWNFFNSSGNFYFLPMALRRQTSVLLSPCAEEYISSQWFYCMKPFEVPTSLKGVQVKIATSYVLKIFPEECSYSCHQFSKLDKVHVYYHNASFYFPLLFSFILNFCHLCGFLSCLLAQPSFLGHGWVFRLLYSDIFIKL